MNRHATRFMRLSGGLLVATAIAPWLGGAVAHASTGPVSGDPRATAVAGNATTCADVGFPNDTKVGSDNSGGVDSDGWVVDSDGTNLTVSAIPDGQQIDVLVVKGGDNYNEYFNSVFATLPVSGLHAPLVGSEDQNVPTISHWFLCASPVQTETTPPTASITPGCDSVTVTFNAGSDAEEFTVNPAGTSGSDTVDVDANGSSQKSYDVTAANPTVTVFDSDENQLATFTRESSCDEEQSVTNPAVSFKNACASGITVTLSNTQVDDTLTSPVTFTITTPSGSTQHVTVNANQIVRRHYAVAEDTTGTVTVSAPGLTAVTHSFAKNCTQVLGEKTVKPPTNVKGTKTVRQLPFTGLPTGWATLIAGSLLALGTGLMWAGRRRQAGETL